MNLVFLVPSLSMQLLFRLEGLWPYILVVITTALLRWSKSERSVLFCADSDPVCSVSWDLGCWETLAIVTTGKTWLPVYWSIIFVGHIGKRQYQAVVFLEEIVINWEALCTRILSDDDGGDDESTMELFCENS